MTEGADRGRVKPFRRILGDVLIVLSLALTADVSAVMLRRIGTVVREAAYRSVFRYELLLCGVLLAFSLDLRFGFFTRWKRKAARGIGWALRLAVTAMTAAVLFFCCGVAAGSVMRTAEAADYAVVLGVALENGEPTRDLLSRRHARAPA